MHAKDLEGGVINDIVMLLTELNVENTANVALIPKKSRNLSIRKIPIIVQIRRLLFYVLIPFMDVLI